MNYTEAYKGLISEARGRVKPDCYCERHHVTPRSMGGCDNPSNLVYLTADEHFMAHWYLANIHNNREMWCALNMMINSAKVSSETAAQFAHAYKIGRERYSESISGSENPFHGKSHTSEVKSKLSKLASSRVGESSSNWRGGAKATCPDCGLERKSRHNKSTRCAPCLTRHKISTVKRVEYECGCGAKLLSGNMKLCSSCYKQEMNDKPWINGRADKDLWGRADAIHSLWVDNGRCGSKKLATVTGVKRSAITNMHRKLSSGWNPIEDKFWLEFAGVSKDG